MRLEFSGLDPDEILKRRNAKRRSKRKPPNKTLVMIETMCVIVFWFFLACMSGIVILGRFGIRVELIEKPIELMLPVVARTKTLIHSIIKKMLPVVARGQTLIHSIIKKITNFFSKNP